MTGPEPAFITSENWKQVSDLLFSLWLILGSGLGLGFSILLAHGMIPSLAATRDIPAAAAKRARPVMYASSLFFLALGLFGLVLFYGRLDIVSQLFWDGAQ
jgi:hypothetical protein